MGTVCSHYGQYDKIGNTTIRLWLQHAWELYTLALKAEAPAQAPAPRLLPFDCYNSVLLYAATTVSTDYANYLDGPFKTRAEGAVRSRLAADSEEAKLQLQVKELKQEVADWSAAVKPWEDELMPLRPRLEDLRRAKVAAAKAYWTGVSFSLGGGLLVLLVLVQFSYAPVFQR